MTSRKSRLVALLLLSAACLIAAERVKPRIIVTQDGEVDDRSSMIRFLMYSSDFDVIGIVENNSIFQKNGHSRDKWIQAQIDTYAKVLPNLKVHHPDFPSPDYLKSIIRLGNENIADLPQSPTWVVAPTDMKTKDTPGSELIIKTLLDDDPRPVHVPAWGGANTIAYALWKIKTTQPDKWKYAASRIWVYCIAYNLTDKAQDGGVKWIIDNMPDVKIFQSAWWSRTWNYSSIGSGSYNPAEIQAYMNNAWLSRNVKTGHGPLGAMYPQDYVSEGDTPAWLALIDNGLDQDVDYTRGGWAGRPVYKSNGYMVDGVEDPSESNVNKRHAKAFYRWIPAAQNDFAARMDWSVATRYSDANHPPVAKVVGTKVRSVAPGQVVALDASPTTDPDGNNLKYRWWQYFEADDATSKITIANDASAHAASFVVPNEIGKQVQVILEVTDDGSPSLTSYQRLLFNITSTSGLERRANAKIAISSRAILLPGSESGMGIESGWVYDLTGRMVTRFQFGPQEGSRRVDLSNLESGAYVLRYEVDGRYVSEPFTLF